MIMDMFSQFQDIADIIDYIRHNWWWLLIALVLGFTMVSMLIKWVLSKIVLWILKLIYYIVTFPIYLIIKYPWLLIIIFFVLLVFIL